MRYSASHLVWVALLAASVLSIEVDGAQLTQPRSLTGDHQVRSANAIARRTLEPVDVNAALLADQQRPRQPVPLRVAVPVPVSLDLNADGTFEPPCQWRDALATSRR